MSDDRMTLSDADLEHRLTALGSRLRYPPTPDVTAAVRPQLEQARGRERPWPAAGRWRALLYPVFAALLMLGSLLALSAGARSAVASWFHLAGVQIEERPPAPGPLGHSLNLGTHLTLGQAQRSVPFHISTPPGALSKPDEVYVGNRSQMGPSVALVYQSRRGLRPASTTGAGLLIMEFRALFWDAKLLAPGTSIQQVRVNGDVGIWLSGRPHDLFYVDRHSRILRDTGRLAGNALVWQRGTVTFRIEGRLNLNQALSIARSMR